MQLKIYQTQPVRFAKILFYHLSVISLLTMISCSDNKQARLMAEHAAECVPIPPLPAYSTGLPEPVGATQLDSLLTKRFSTAALETASVCKLLPMLRGLARAEKEGKPVASWQQRINQQLMIATLELASVAAELDCHEETADQIADYIAEQKSNRTRTLTLLSILVGALGGVLTSVMALRNVSKTVIKYSAIAFGLTGAAIGLTTLMTNQQVLVSHERNPLKDILIGPAQSAYFPSSVWRYLNQPNSRNPQHRSVRQYLIKRWVSFEGINADRVTSGESRLLGKSGLYNADELHQRANLFDQLESEVNLMNYDLQRLAYEVGMPKLMH